MCGIIGYVGKQKALPILLHGLKMLEYRGYDSAGIAYLDKSKITTVKSVGKVSLLCDKANENKPLYWNDSDVKFFKDTTEFYNTTSQGLQIWKDVLRSPVSINLVR